MRVAVVGLGSMGKRRIRLIREINAAHEIIGIDTSQERREETELKYGIITTDSLDSISGHIDSAVICTSPLSHAKIINQCLSRGWNVFTEINLIQDMYSTNIHLAKEKGVVLFLSSTLIYRDEIQYIKQAVDNCNCKLNYVYHIGQYLPDWHPWESYKSFFVGDKRTNGCREIMAIEFPWLVDTFGSFDKVESRSDRMSSLDIDYSDNYIITIEHQRGVKGVVVIDVVSRKPVRNFELFGENLYLTWSGSPEGVMRYNFETKQDQIISFADVAERQEGYSSFVIENAYKRELEAFFEQIAFGKQPMHSFDKDKAVLDTIDQIENIRA